MKFYIIFIILLSHSFISPGQDATEANKHTIRIPLILTASFQNFSLPFRDLKSNFSHQGFTIGTELALNKKGTLVQQFQFGAYRNKEAGNGWMIFSQFTYRPSFFRQFYAELKGGIGWQRVYHPVQAFEFKNGKWEPTKGGKSQLIAPIGITAGYANKTTGRRISPFISYQLVPALFYNDIIPVNFYSHIQIGSFIYFK